MPDVYDIDPRHPKFETSREPEQKLFSFRQEFEDNNRMYHYFIKGFYHDTENGGISIVDYTLLIEPSPRISAETLYWILAPEIQRYLKITGHVHFESKLEL